jgi:hypothetical protein
MILPGFTAVDEQRESLLMGLSRGAGADVARYWAELSNGIGEWRAEIQEQKFRWESDHSCELSPAVDLREALGDGVVEQTERLRTDAGALIRLIERARDVAVEPQAVPAGDPGDGLFANERCFIWGGRRFERLTEKMVKVLAVFDDQFRAGFPIVNLPTIESKTGIQFDGAFISQAFKQNRKGEPTIHPVADVIVNVGRGEYRLTEPQKLKI